MMQQVAIHARVSAARTVVSQLANATCPKENKKQEDQAQMDSGVFQFDGNDEATPTHELLQLNDSQDEAMSATSVEYSTPARREQTEKHLTHLQENSYSKDAESGVRKTPCRA